MSRFTARILRNLDNLYDFVGGQTGPQEFQQDSPIQPVHDMSRLAEIGSGFSGQFGFFLGGQTDVHAGAGAIRVASDPWLNVDARSIPRNQASVWLMYCFVTANSTANYVDAIFSVTYPELPGAFASAPEIPVGFWPDVLGSAVTGSIIAGDLATDPMTIPLPLYFPDGATFNTKTEAVTGAVNIAARGVFWAGANGARPPGLA